jgi:hypothetical protein
MVYFTATSVSDNRALIYNSTRMDIGKNSFANRTIKNWNQISAEALGTFLCKPKIFRKIVRKAIINRVK